MGLTVPGYAFISYELLLDFCVKSHSNLTQSEREECEVLEGILDISLFVPQNEEYKNFSKLVRKNMAEWPFYRTMPAEESVSDMSFFCFKSDKLYICISMFRIRPVILTYRILNNITVTVKVRHKLI